MNHQDFENSGLGSEMVGESVHESHPYSQPGEKSLKKELVEYLSKILPLFSPSYAEEPVVEFCRNELLSAGFEVQSQGTNNLIATRRGNLLDGEKCICINAHTDTVQSSRDRILIQNPRIVIYDGALGTFHTNGHAIMGGDDKCGISVALVLAKYTDLPLKIVLTACEEVGGLGAKELTAMEFKDVEFVITIDRKSNSDIIQEYGGRTCAPDAVVDKFAEIARDATGIIYKRNDGTIADTFTIARFVPAINVSSGYYKPHTPAEFVAVEDTYQTMMAVKATIERRHEIIDAIASAPKWEKTGKYDAYH